MKNLLFALSILLLISCGDETTTTPSDSEFCSDISKMPEGAENTTVRLVNYFPFVADINFESFELKDFKKGFSDLTSYYITDEKGNIWYMNQLQAGIIVRNGADCRSFLFEYFEDTELQTGDSILLFDSLDNKIQTYIIP